MPKSSTAIRKGGVALCGAGLLLTATACAGQSSEPAPTQTVTITSPAMSTPAQGSASSQPNTSHSPASTAAQQHKPVPTFTFNVPPPEQQRADVPIRHYMTPSWEQQTLAQISQFTGVPAEQYVGLASDKTFIATNNSGFTYWVATAAVPGESEAAKQSVQGASSYFLIQYDQHGNVDVFPVAKIGYQEPNRCAAARLPDSIRELWGWTATDCPPF